MLDKVNNLSYSYNIDSLKERELILSYKKQRG